MLAAFACGNVPGAVKDYLVADRGDCAHLPLIFPSSHASSASTCPRKSPGSTPTSREALLLRVHATNEYPLLLRPVTPEALLRRGSEIHETLLSQISRGSTSVCPRVSLGYTATDPRDPNQYEYTARSSHTSSSEQAPSLPSCRSFGSFCSRTSTSENRSILWRSRSPDIGKRSASLPSEQFISANLLQGSSNSHSSCGCRLAEQVSPFEQFTEKYLESDAPDGWWISGVSSYARRPAPTFSRDCCGSDVCRKDFETSLTSRTQFDFRGTESGPSANVHALLPESDVRSLQSAPSLQSILFQTSPSEFSYSAPLSQVCSRCRELDSL